MKQDQQIPRTPRKDMPYQGPLKILGTPAPRLDLWTSPGETLNPEVQGVIYGTSIKLNHITREIRHFLLTFEVTIQKDEEFITQRPYLIKLGQLERQKQKGQTLNSFDIDALHLHRYSREIYLQLIYFPAQVIHIFDQVLKNIFQKEFVQNQTDHDSKIGLLSIVKELRVGFINLHSKDQFCVKDLVPCMLGRLVQLTGLVIRTSEVYPQMKTAHFQCTFCKQVVIVELENARIDEPKSCQKCKKKQTLQLIHNLCKFESKQYIKLQQLLQNISQGQSPASITLIAYDTNVDKIRPGDCIKITGIYRCNMNKIVRRMQIFKSIFSTYFDTISISVLQGRSKRIKVNQKCFDQKKKDQFFKIANSDNPIQKLASSFASGIFGHKEVKKGLLAQLFGGNRQSSGGTRFRSEVNICLVGDPSTAKSQLLQQVNRVAPRSVYTCGRGATSSGLTANVRKDPQTRQFMLESGALVLSDEGICCIDQFDKMHPRIHTTLLQVMQQQTISIAKAGIVCQLNSRTAILAAANPIQSKYDVKKSVVQNINMPPALLSRFDLIYIMLDIANRQEDFKIACHILNIYSKNPEIKQTEGIIDSQLLADYISFAREIKPTISQAAALKIQSQYLKLRQQGQSMFTIAATPRMLQSLIRISQAFAKMRLSNEVSQKDAEQAINLMNFATLKAATDPQSGLIDMGIITTGRSAVAMMKVKEISTKIKIVLAANESKFLKSTQVDLFYEDYRKIYSQADVQVSRQQLGDAMKMLDCSDYIHLFINYKNKQAFKLRQTSE